MPVKNSNDICCMQLKRANYAIESCYAQFYPNADLEQFQDASRRANNLVNYQTIHDKQYTIVKQKIKTVQA